MDISHSELYALYEKYIFAIIPPQYRNIFIPYEPFIIQGLRGIIAEVQQPECIFGGEPHASHCPANPDPFLKVNV